MIRGKIRWGDLAVYPHIAISLAQGFAPAAESNLEAWLARVSQSPSVQRCQQAAMEAFATFQDRSATVEQGLFIREYREYRDHRVEWMMRSGGVEIVLNGIAKKNIRFANELE